jgi:hypothetical protein
MLNFCAVVIVVLAISGVANADLVTTYSWSQANSYTNWTQSFALQQFNPGLGTLNSVTVTLNGTLDQTLRYENKDGAGRYVKYFFSSDDTDKTRCEYSLSFTGGSLGTIIYNAPSYTNIPTFDGTVDYAGASGATHEFLLNQSANNVYTDGAMSPFVGTGSVAFDASATAWMLVKYSGGNMSLSPITLAGAGVTVAYDYTPIPGPTPGPIPEPTTIALLGLGALGLLKKRRA